MKVLEGGKVKGNKLSVNHINYQQDMIDNPRGTLTLAVTNRYLIGIKDENHTWYWKPNSSVLAKSWILKVNLQSPLYLISINPNNNLNICPDTH